MHYLRLKRARQIAQKQWRRETQWWGLSENHLIRPKEVFVGRYRKTQVFYSGPCWGNPRKWFGEKTVQEKKADINMKQQLEDL